MPIHSLFSLKKSTAVITGAASGLGRQFALTLAELRIDPVITSEVIGISLFI